MSIRVVLATHNAHKVAEFQEILGRVLPDIEIVAYDGPEPIEDGASFTANALIKARAAAEFTGLPALADDSGICVGIMSGAPGIFSARWAGPGKGAEANLNLLLAQLGDIHGANREAWFTCAIALVVPAGAGADPAADAFAHVAVGEWRGSLAEAPQGERGFGYDPIFLPDGLPEPQAGLSAAELTAEQKNAVSHRTRAFTEMIPVLRMSVIPN